MNAPVKIDLAPFRPPGSAAPRPDLPDVTKSPTPISDPPSGMPRSQTTPPIAFKMREEHSHCSHGSHRSYSSHVGLLFHGMFHTPPRSVRSFDKICERGNYRRNIGRIPTTELIGHQHIPNKSDKSEANFTI